MEGYASSLTPPLPRPTLEVSTKKLNRERRFKFLAQLYITDTNVSMRFFKPPLKVYEYTNFKYKSKPPVSVYNGFRMPGSGGVNPFAYKRVNFTHSRPFSKHVVK